VIVGSGAFTLTINGTNFISGSVARVNGSDRTTTFVNATQVTAQVLAADIANAGSLPITVFNPAPAGGLSNAVNLNINNPTPALANLSQDNALAGTAGLTLTLNGSSFVNGAVVKWNGSDRSTSFVNSTQVTAQILAADLATAGSFSLTVANPAPGGGVSNALNFAVNNPLPVVTTLSPTSKLVGDAAFTLTVNGSNFISGAVIRWNGIAKTTTFVNATQLTADIAASDLQVAGNVVISVLNPLPGGGASNSANFTVNNQTPSVSNLAPSSVIVGGAAFTLTVNGSNFIGTSVVRVNGSDRTTTFVNANQLTAQINAADIQTVGSIAITVFNPAPGGGSSSAVILDISNPVPSITSLSPSSAVAGDPALVLTINGSNFVNGSVVKWNGSDRVTTFVNATQLTAQITALDLQTASIASVTVNNPAPGGGTSGGSSFSILTSNSVPQITSLSPLSAIAGDAAFTLTVNGSQFINGSTVKWNGSARTTTFVNANQLTAQILAADIAAAGTGHVSVTTPPPGGGDSNVVDFAVIAPNGVPSITSLSPANATAGDPGFSLTVSGTNFVNGSIVRWDGADRATTFSSSSQLSAQISAADIATAGTHSITVFSPAPGGGISNAMTFTVNNPAPPPASLQFSSATYQMQEASNTIELTVTRTGDTSIPVSADFVTDDATVFIPCVTPTGGANQRCDFSTAGGTLTFAAGETTKIVTLLNTDDAYVEGPETFTVTLRNPNVLTSAPGTATLGAPTQATITIVDNDMVAPTSNPIDDAHYFVNQQYIDFLARVPDTGGINYWTNEINSCGNNLACIHSRRIGVTGAFFVELEFQRTGSVVYRLYKAAYGQHPLYAQFMPDRSQLVDGPQLPATTQAFVNRFVERPEFKAQYPDAMTPAEFVNKLYDTALLLNNPTERQQQIDALTNATSNRAQVLMNVIETPEFKTREYNPSFVLMEYFGYLRRDPDLPGFNFWLDILNNREPNNYRSMICAFITSTEYQERFSSIITRTNADCAQQ
jgi:hypothetical protein